jgi:hypothetical protein
MPTLRKYGPLAVVLVTAAFLRWFNIGAEYLDGDHAYIAIQSLRVARYHEVTLLGPPMAVGLWHSPLSIYLYAIPFAVSTDARLARAFTGLLNVAATGLLFALGERYFGRKTAFVAALLYAVQPEMIVAGRAINNAQLGAPFAVGFLFTGLLGYYEDRRWARWLCLPLLSAAGQCHPYTFAMLPVAGVLLVIALIRWPDRRRLILIDSLIGGLVALLTLMPWAFGFYQFSQTKNFGDVAPNVFTNQGLEFVIRTLYTQLGGPSQIGVAPILPFTLALGSGWLLLRGLRNWAGLPGLIVLLTFFMMPAIVVVLKLHLVWDYFWPTFPIAFLIMGVFIGGGRLPPADTGPWAWNGLLNDTYLRWVAVAGVVVVTTAYLRYDAVQDRRAGLISLDQLIGAMDLGVARAAESKRDLLIVTGGGYDDYMPWEMLSLAYRIRSGSDTRVIYPRRGLPLPQHGAVLIGPADYAGRPDFFSGGQIIFDSIRLTDLPPAGNRPPDRPPLEPIRLSNGAAIIGVWTQGHGNTPVAGRTWTVYVVWRIDRLAAEEQTLFVHLIDSQGNKYAQQDVPALPVGQQRLGETVVSQMDFQLGAGLPAAGPLLLRVGMYSSAGQAKVVNSSGVVLGDFGLIQVRGSPQPQATWTNGLVLDSLSAATPLIQGPPLDVTAVWLAQQALPGAGQLRWRLQDGQGAYLFEHVSDLAAGLGDVSWPAGAFTTQHYILRIPTDIPPGQHAMDVQPLDAAGRPLGSPYTFSIEIGGRDRQFTAPPIEHSVQAVFGGTITLLGYDESVRGRTLQLTLHWKARGQVTGDYKYFVHVWRSGKVVAQKDSVPGDYSYYTSWWAPNEVYSQAVTLDLGALVSGPYTLTTGFYEPVTGQRLSVRLADGSQPENQWVTLQGFDLP